MPLFFKTESSSKPHFHLFWTCGIVLFSCLQTNGLRSVRFFDVSCSYSGIITKMVFERVFRGTVYSQANYFNPNCRYFPPKNGTKEITFFLPLTDCGNFIRESGDDIYVSNSIIVQHHLIVETESDILQNISCKIPRPESKQMETFSHDSHGAHFQNEVIDSWMDIHVDGDVLDSDISNTLFVGDDMTVVVHLKDGGLHKSMKFEKCWAYDGETISVSKFPLKIYDECQDFDWMPNITLSAGMQNVSDLTLYGTVKAFRFPFSKNLHITCSIQVCRKVCESACVKSEKSDKEIVSKRSRRSSEKSSLNPTVRSFLGLKRAKLMKAAIKAFGSKLLGRSRGGSVVSASNAHKITDRNGAYKTDENYPTTDVPESETSNKNIFFNLTNNVVVFKYREFNYRHEYVSENIVQPTCEPELRFKLVTALFVFFTACLFLICVGLLLYIHKENKLHAKDNLLLYKY